MAITVRIVGIFFSTPVTLNGGSGTVKDCLDAAREQAPSGTQFTYTTTNSTSFESPNLFLAKYEAPFTSKVSGQKYPAGEYSLAENLLTKPDYTVWQYYINDNEGRFVNRGKGIIPYNAPEAKVEDGWSVTWRLVTILAQPQAVSTPRLASLSAGA